MAPVELPEELKRGLRAVLEGAVGVLVSLAICSARGCENMTSGKRMNQFIHWGHEEALRGETVDLVGRLHNDDVHTYDNVTDALKSVGLSDARAAEKTRLVDEMGKIIVRSRSPSPSQGNCLPPSTHTHTLPPLLLTRYAPYSLLTFTLPSPSYRPCGGAGGHQ